MDPICVQDAVPMLREAKSRWLRSGRLAPRFRCEAIREGRDTDADMKAFMYEWDTNHRGTTVQVVAMAAWTSAHDEVVGEAEPPS
jgi:hypothetical protein